MLRWGRSETIHHFYTTFTPIHYRLTKIFEQICTNWSNKQSDKTESDALIYKAMRICDDL